MTDIATISSWSEPSPPASRLTLKARRLRDQTDHPDNSAYRIAPRNLWLSSVAQLHPSGNAQSPIHNASTDHPTLPRPVLPLSREGPCSDLALTPEGDA